MPNKQRIASVVVISLVLGAFLAVGGALATHDGISLEISPEVGTGNAVNVAYTLTAKIPATTPAPTGGIEIDFEDMTNDATPASPDTECTILEGDTSCDVTFNSAAAGTVLIRGWIDHDVKNESGESGVTEVDLVEGRFSGDYLGPGGTPTPPHPGDCTPDDTFAACHSGTPTAGTAEGDNTDVVELSWAASPPPPPARLDCDVESAINPTSGGDSTETYTCRLTDESGAAQSGAKIDAENMDGANDDDDASAGPPDESCSTLADGTCTIAFAYDGQTGPAEICFWGDNDDDDGFTLGGQPQDGGECGTEAVYIASDGSFETEGNDLTDKVRKTWRASIANGFYSGQDIARDLELLPDSTVPYGRLSEGYTLDGNGGIHAFGGAPAVTGGPSWPGWDIARDLVILPDSTITSVRGYVLDGWGGMHPFGGAPPISFGPYWGWDIARDVELLSDSDVNGVSGYVLDGWGGLHRIQGGDHAVPPVISDGPYWGWDIARDLEIWDADEGYVMDGYGGVHEYGGADNIGGPYWDGFDIANDLELLAEGAGWILDGWGGVHVMGGAPYVDSGPYWQNWDIARAFEFFDAGVFILDGFGGRHQREFT